MLLCALLFSALLRLFLLLVLRSTWFWGLAYVSTAFLCHS
eukprot:COSAG01_NODE_54517_length_331_cov_1.375000_1_plen_39_part_01